MMKNQLTPELISLVHHVELNKSGWWEKSTQQLILFAFCTIQTPLNVEEVADLLQTKFSAEIDKGKLEQQLKRLRKSLELISPREGYFILPETAKIKYQNQLAEGEKLEETVKDFFINLVKPESEELDAVQLWEDFCSKYFYPLIKETGANTYNLINGSSLSSDFVRFENFLKTYPENNHDEIREIVDEFLTTSNQEVRSFVLRSLNAYFFVEATSLREESLVALTKATKKSIVFTVFIDTNLLIAILGLKDSVDEAGKLLLQLVERLSGKVQIKLSVLPITLDETRNLLANKKSKLRNLRLNSNLVEAALNMGLDEIDSKFIQTYKATGISADDYFEDYLSDLQAVIREKDIIFRNESTDSYTMRQDVIDDINVQLDFEKEKFEGKEKFKGVAKSYEKLEHDIILWHFVNDRRSAQIESPLAAELWILTFDSRFRAFDNYKKNAARNKIPICLHPLTFIQMLQFWVPRSPEFEEAILTSLRMPFLSQEFDAHSQQVTLDIIKALGKYQNIGNFKKETVSEILMNKALRQKISSQKNENEQFELVEGVLIQKYQEAEKKLAETRKEKDLIASESSERSVANQKLLGQLNQKTQQIEAIQTELSNEKEEKIKLENQEVIRKERADFGKKWIIYPFLTITGVGLASWAIASKFTENYPYLALLIWLPLLLGLIRLVDWQGGGRENIRDWKMYQLLHNFRKLLYWILGITWGLIGGALGTPIWDWMKTYLKNP